MTSSILVEGVRIAFADHGTGTPVVFLHGFPLNRRMWAPQVEALASFMRVIAIDLRGHGESDAPLWRYHVEQFADDVAAVLDHLSVARAVLVGLSMGGYVALSFVRRHAAHLKGLVLTDTRAQADTDAARAARFQMAQAALAKGPGAVADLMLPKLLAPTTLETNPSLVRQVRALIEGMSISGIAGDLMAMADRADSLSLLSSTRCPTLVLVGEQDQATPVADARLMADAIPEAQLVIIPNAGHLPNLEQPDRFNEILRRFVGSLS